MNGRNTQPIWAPTSPNTVTQQKNTFFTCRFNRIHTGDSIALGTSLASTGDCSVPSNISVPESSDVIVGVFDVDGELDVGRSDELVGFT